MKSVQKDKFLIDIRKVRPSQLYLSEKKISALAEYDPFNTDNDPLPVIRLEDEIIFTDGHTRAFLYWKKGEQEIPVYWDKDELDLELYSTCLSWCRKEHLRYIGDLEGRTLSPKDYQKLWIERCEKAASRLGDG